MEMVSLIEEGTEGFEIVRNTMTAVGLDARETIESQV